MRSSPIMDWYPSLFIVDDDEDDCELLQRAFRKSRMPCNLVFFTNGLQLIQYLDTIDRMEYPALILLDLNMPVMDGFETLQLLKTSNAYRSIPTLVLTSSPFPNDVEHTYHLGSNAYISKPDTFANLVALVDLTTQFWLQSALTPARTGVRRIQ